MTYISPSLRCIPLSIILVFLLSFLFSPDIQAQGPVNVYVDVIELNHGYDCGNDGAFGDEPDPRWKFWGGHSGGNWVYYGCYNGGSRSCGVWNIGDFDLINVTNTTATQVNVDLESWEEDGCGGDCDANTCTFNDDDCRSGRARILDINFRRDAPNTYNQSGWGYRGCSYGARVDVLYECLDWGDQVAYGSNSWRGYVYDGTGFNTYMGYITQSEIFDQNFAGDGDGDWYATSCREFQKSSFSVRYKMSKRFACGYYTFTVGSDDGVRLSIDGGNTWIINQWVDRGYTTNSSSSIFLSGNTNLVLEYYENGGGNRVSFNYSFTPYNAPGNPAVFGNGVWNVYAWNAGDAAGNSGSWSSNYSGYYTINSLNFDTRPGQTYSVNTWDPGTQSPSNAPGYQGCTVDPDNHSYAFKRQGFPCGYYQINLPNHDDRVVLFVNGVSRYDQSACCQTRTNIWQGFLGSSSTLELRISEGGGGSHGSIELVKQYDLAITSSNTAMNCSDGPRTLTANVSGGTWSGSAGVSGNTFNPNTAGPGTHTITYSVEGCSVNQTITVSAPGNPSAWGLNQWHVYAYNGNTFNTYYGYYVVNSLDMDTRDQWVANSTPSNAPGYQGCTVPIDQHSYRLRRQGFPCGFYTISISNDDDWTLSVNGTQVNSGGCCSTTPFSVATNVWLDASSTVELTIREGGGDSYGEINFTKTGDLAITSSNASMNCSNPSRTLTANQAGGTFSGPGVSGGVFNPTTAGLGTHTITYTLNGCTATQQIAVGAPGNPSTFGSNIWNVFVYNAGDGQGTGGDWVNNYSGYYTISNLSFDTRTGQTYSTAQSWPDSPSQASGYVGCPVGVDNHSWTAKRTGFTCGLYKISIVGHDDIAQLWIDGVKVFDNFPWSGAAGQPLTYPYTAWMGELSATSTVEFRVGEAGGGSFGAIEVLPVTASTMIATVTPTNVNCYGNNNGALNVNLSGGLSNARVIKITQKLNDFLNLAEVQAFDLNGNNVALSNNGSSVTGSTTHGSYPLNNLIDGNTTNFAHSGTVTDGRGQWMQITLPANAQLDRIVVYNRTDCCQNRAANLLVEVFSDVAATNLLFGKTINANATYPTPVTINVMDLNWSNGATILNQNNLGPGSYNLTVSNAAFCGAGNATGGATITEPSDLTVNATATNETCIGNNDGAVNITVSGGVINYSFVWSNGATTEDISGLSAGTYSVTVTDANGCTETASANVTVTPAINNTISGGGPTAYCNYGDPTSLGGTVSGGTGVYGIQWQVSTDGSTYINISGATSSSYDPGQINQSTWYRRVVTSGPCAEISNAIWFTVTYQTTYTWTGAVNNSWNVDGNWDCGHVPDNTIDVVIPAAPVNQPVVLSGNTGLCKTIDVQSGANVTIQPNAVLNVSQ